MGVLFADAPMAERSNVTDLRASVQTVPELPFVGLGYGWTETEANRRCVTVVTDSSICLTTAFPTPTLEGDPA